MELRISVLPTRTFGILAAIFFGVLATVLLGACGDSRSPAAAETPTLPTTLVVPVSDPKLTREQVVAIAGDAFTQDHLLATAVEDPRNMVTRLMRFREIRNAESHRYVGEYFDALVWIAQVEGSSRPTPNNVDFSRDRTVYRFNAVAIDVSTGNVVARLFSEYEPFILPLDFVPDDLVDAGLDERDIRRDLLPISRDEAVQLVIDEYGDPRHRDIGAIETSLVWYSNPRLPGDDSVGPLATPTSVAHPTATPTTGPPGSSTPTATRQARATRVPVVDRLSWLVILPSHMSFSGCFLSGPGGFDHHLTCWITVYYFYVDAETGHLYDGSNQGFIGPSLSNEERQALQRFAWDEGWWNLWHEVRQYNFTRIPEGLAAQLDRPNAPTPTPRPPTPTPLPGSPAPPTPTPTPVPPTTATG